MTAWFSSIGGLKDMSANWMSTALDLLTCSSQLWQVFFSDVFGTFVRKERLLKNTTELLSSSSFPEELFPWSRCLPPKTRPPQRSTGSQTTERVSHVRQVCAITIGSTVWAVKERESPLLLVHTTISRDARVDAAGRACACSYGVGGWPCGWFCGVTGTAGAVQLTLVHAACRRARLLRPSYALFNIYECFSIFYFARSFPGIFRALFSIHLKVDESANLVPFVRWLLTAIVPARNSCTGLISRLCGPSGRYRVSPKYRCR